MERYVNLVQLQPDHRPVVRNGMRPDDPVDITAMTDITTDGYIHILQYMPLPGCPCLCIWAFILKTIRDANALFRYKPNSNAWVERPYIYFEHNMRGDLNSKGCMSAHECTIT